MFSGKLAGHSRSTLKSFELDKEANIAVKVSEATRSHEDGSSRLVIKLETFTTDSLCVHSAVAGFRGSLQHPIDNSLTAETFAHGMREAVLHLNLKSDQIQASGSSATYMELQFHTINILYTINI